MQPTTARQTAIMVLGILWGKNFPFHYDPYRRTTDSQRTRYGGSEALPRTPSQADPTQRVDRERRIPDPGVAIVPVTRPTNGLGQ